MTKTALSILICLALVLPGCVMKSTFEEQVTQNQQLNSKVAELSDQLADSYARNQALKTDLESSRKTIESLDLHTRNLAVEIEQERLEKQQVLEKMQSSYNQLAEQMEQEIERGEITISELEGKLTVNMVDSILFASGSARIKKEGLQVLKRVADIVKDVEDKDIQVEGHTDNIPISPRIQKIFESNWELSTARAVTVVRFLQEQGIPGEKLTALGYGEYHPIASNDTRKGRAQNRRIQIVLVPKAQHIVKPVVE